MCKWGVSIFIFHHSKLWKAKFFILCDVIFLVRLQGKFEIDHSWSEGVEENWVGLRGSVWQNTGLSTKSWSGNNGSPFLLEAFHYPVWYRALSFLAASHFAYAFTVGYHQARTRVHLATSGQDNCPWRLGDLVADHRRRKDESERPFPSSPLLSLYQSGPPSLVPPPPLPPGWLSPCCHSVPGFLAWGPDDVTH